MPEWLRDVLDHALIVLVAIALVVIGFNLLGDGLRDWLSPR